VGESNPNEAESSRRGVSTIRYVRFVFEYASSRFLLRSVPAQAPAPDGDLLLRPASAPPADAVWSLAPRTMEAATREGWRTVRVLAWTWNRTGPVQWRCAVDQGDGSVDWRDYDVRLIRHPA
jgi:hypothetical protein